MKIYVASSWRNEARQQATVRELREAGHEVYDFRNPAPGNSGFAWSSIDPNWQEWNPETFRAALHHPIAEQGFAFDFNAMKSADACVLVSPCGRSAHLELGWCAGAGKKSIVLLAPGEPELMYKIADHICTSLSEVVEHLREHEEAQRLAADRLTFPIAITAAAPDDGPEVKIEAPDEDVVQCPDCAGEGVVFADDDTHEAECPLCRGTGEVEVSALAEGGAS